MAAPTIASLLPPTATFLWPRGASALSHLTIPTLDLELEEKLKELEIHREEVEGQLEEVEAAARTSGKEVARKQIRITFDTFLARNRPGLGSNEEEARKLKNRKKKKKKKAKANENKKSWHDDKENKVIKTEGWENPAWKTNFRKFIQPESSFEQNTRTF